MAAFEAQQLLARLYTDPNALEEFLADRERFCRSHAFGCEDLIREIDAAQVAFFANSLRSKRAAEVRKLLPITDQALGAGFAMQFDQYAASTLPGGVRKHLADSMAFCEYLIGTQSVSQRVREAAQFELLAFKVSFELKRQGGSPVVATAHQARRQWFTLRRFHYEMLVSVGDEDLPRKGKGRRLTLFARLPGLRGVWFW